VDRGLLVLLRIVVNGGLGHFIFEFTGKTLEQCSEAQHCRTVSLTANYFVISEAQNLIGLIQGLGLIELQGIAEILIMFRVFHQCSPFYKNGLATRRSTCGLFHLLSIKGCNYY